MNLPGGVLTVYRKRSFGSASSMFCAARGRSISRPLPIGLTWRASVRAACDRVASAASFT
jgi:hypothetical protein